MINVLYEDNHLLVVYKPANIPVQADSSKDMDLLTTCKNYLKEKYQKPGNVYLGLIHRLDRMTSGVIVFGKTSKASSRLSEQVRGNKMHKSYLALVCGIPPKEGTLHNFLLKDERLNKSTVAPKEITGCKEAILNYKVLSSNNKYSLVEVDLVTGRSHQIRVQFSYIGHPLLGDIKYNIIDKTKIPLQLLAYRLTFYHPISKELLTFTSTYKLKDIG